MSKRHSISFRPRAKHAMTAASSSSMRRSKLCITKKLASLCVMFPKRRCYFLTPLQCMAWTGRRDKRGLPVCLFDMAYLTSNLDAYKKSCDSLDTSRPTPTGVPSAVTIRSLAVYEGMVRFVLPLCSLVRERPSPETPIFQATVIADMSGVSLVQIWRIRSWFQTFSKLADGYPEILDRVVVSQTNQIDSHTRLLARQSTNKERTYLTLTRSSVLRHTFQRFGNGPKTGWILSQPLNS